MKRLLTFPLLLIMLCASIAWASGTPASILSPDQALERLMRGNERFVTGKPIHPNQDAFRRSSTGKEGQRPYATILGCSDSREPVELIFDAGVGDLFVVRVAGNTTYADQAGTIEYGAEHLGVPLLVVLGHTKCGAVSAVINGDHVGGNIPALVANIIPAANKAKADNPSLAGAELIDKAIVANTWQSIEDLFKQSPEVRGLVQSGKMKVVGGVYDLEHGTVNWMGEHPKQAELLTLTSGPKD